MNDRFTPDEIAVIQRAWASIRPVLAAAAAALTPTRDEFALVPNDVAAAAVIPARRALAACLDGDDQHAAELLEGLDADQLYAIEGAGSGLAIHASRHRKRLAQADADGQDGRVSVDEYERLLTQDEQPEPARVLSRAGDRLAAAEALTDLAADEDLARLCLDQDEQPGEWRGASCTGAYVDEIAGLDRLAPWERDLLAAKATEQTAEEQPITLDLHALNTAISDALARWHEPGVYPDPGGMLAAVREAVDPMLFGLRDRAQAAEKALDYGAARLYRHLGKVTQERDEARTAHEATTERLLRQLGDATAAQAAAERRAETLRASRDEIREKLPQAEAAMREAQDDVRYLRGELSKADDENNATGERAKRLGARLDEMKRRAERAEAEAADWRTTAHGYEQALRAEQAEASLQVTRLTSERDEARKRVDALGDEARLLAGDLAQERRAAGTYREQRDAAREDAETAHRHLRARARDLATTDPDAFREWLRTEIHRDPKWWREILRRELRLGHLRDDFRRAGLTATVRDTTDDPDAWRP